MTLATTGQETPLWIQSGDQQLFAVHTAPTSEPLGVGILLLSGGGWIPSTQRNRMYVRLARKLAGHGFDVLRFDYGGVGESTGETRFFDLMTPHTPEVLAAVDALRSRGVTGIGLVGTCYGGRMGLHAAESVPELEVMAVSCIPVEDYPGASENLLWHGRRAISADVWQRLRTKWPKYLRVIKTQLVAMTHRFWDRALSRPTNRTHPEYIRQFSRVLERGVPTLVLHGRHDNHFPQFSSALDAELGQVLGAKPDLVTLDLWDGELHGERSIAAQRYTIDQIETFLGSWAEQHRARA